MVFLKKISTLDIDFSRRYYIAWLSMYETTGNKNTSSGIDGNSNIKKKLFLVNREIHWGKNGRKKLGRKIDTCKKVEKINS